MKNLLILKCTGLILWIFVFLFSIYSCKIHYLINKYKIVYELKDRQLKIIERFFDDKYQYYVQDSKGLNYELLSYNAKLQDILMYSVNEPVYNISSSNNTLYVYCDDGVIVKKKEIKKLNLKIIVINK